MSTEELRFKVVDGSQTAHCCFEATVVDTNKPIVHGDYKPEGRYEPVCECFEKADAEAVCAALNLMEDAKAYREAVEVSGRTTQSAIRAYDRMIKTIVTPRKGSPT